MRSPSDGQWWSTANGDATTTLFLNPDADDAVLLEAVDELLRGCHTPEWLVYYAAPMGQWDRLILEHVTTW